MTGLVGLLAAAVAVVAAAGYWCWCLYPRDRGTVLAAAVVGCWCLLYLSPRDQGIVLVAAAAAAAARSLLRHRMGWRLPGRDW